MKILIIPYDGGNQSQANTSEGVTRTQHAAREYHRQAKLRRVKDKDRTQNGSNRSRTAGKGSVSDETDSAGTAELQPEQGSPLQTLLGVSRADPFKTGCISDAPLYVHEMLEHALTYQWSEFRHSDAGDMLNAAKGELMHSVLKSPQAWYAVVYAGATHDAYQHGVCGVPKQNEQLRLYYKTKAIEAVLEDVSQNGDMVSEETLLSMIILASHGTGEQLNGADSAKRRDLRLPFMPHVHGVEYYSAMETGSEHLKAIYSLVDKRGGLRTVRQRSLVISIQLRVCPLDFRQLADIARYDIYASWKELKAPHFDLLVPTKYCIRLRSHKSDALANDMLEERRIGFHALLSVYPNLDHIVEIANDAGTFSADFDQLLRCFNLPKEEQRFGTPNVALVKFTRWCILHDILMLPAAETNHALEPEHTISEMCRLILLAYALFAIVPMPSESKLSGIIADKIERILHNAIELGIAAKHPDLFLCAIGWAFMCAHKSVGHPKLGKLLRTLVGFLEYQDLVLLEAKEWPTVADIMKSFLWLETYCEEPGRKFWVCACGIAQRKTRRGSRSSTMADGLS